MLRKQLNKDDMILIIEILGFVVVLGEIGSAIMGLLHLQEMPAVVHLADTALGGLLTLLVSPNARGKLLGKTRIHKVLSVHHDAPGPVPCVPVCVPDTKTASTGGSVQPVSPPASESEKTDDSDSNAG